MNSGRDSCLSPSWSIDKGWEEVVQLGLYLKLTESTTEEPPQKPNRISPPTLRRGVPFSVVVLPAHWSPSGPEQCHNGEGLTQVPNNLLDHELEHAPAVLRVKE